MDGNKARNIINKQINTSKKSTASLSKVSTMSIEKITITRKKTYKTT